jgi:hypothetical protein
MMPRDRWMVTRTGASFSTAHVTEYGLSSGIGSLAFDNMALDRKIRVALQLSNAFADPDYEGEDFEKRKEQGKAILATSFEQLVRGRDRQNGILGEGEELSAPDSLTKAAESAMRNEMTDIAAVAVREFFLQDPPRNQFYCRSLFVKAQLESLKVNGLDGDKALAQTQKAIDIVLAAVDIMLLPQNQPRYDFLVYNASVHYWRVARPILRPGVMQFAVPSMTKMVEALSQTKDEDLVWRAKFHMALAKCHDDAGEVAPSMAQAATALGLAREATAGGRADPEVYDLLESAKRLRIHMSRKDVGAAKHLESAKGEENGDIRGTAIVILQGLDSGILSPDVAEDKLSEIFTSMNEVGGGDTGVGDENESPSRTKKVFISDLLVDAGRLATRFRHFNLAQSFVELFERQKGNPGKAGMRIDFLRCELIVESLRDKPRETGKKLRGRHKEDDSNDILKMDKRRIDAMRISRRIEAVKRLERVLMACQRAEDPDLLHEGCILAWNVSMPLLQAHLLKHVHRLFTIAANALEDIDSPLKPLRAKFHFEVAKCEIAQDFLAKAVTHINKALTLDYGRIAVAMEKEGVDPGAGKKAAPTKGKKGKKGASSRPTSTTSVVTSDLGLSDDALRPLDRFLKPLQAKLELKSNIYKEPDTPIEKATILLEQAKDARDAHLKASLVQRAVILLKNDEDKANIDEEARPQTDASTDSAQPGLSPTELRKISEGVVMWSEISKMAWSLRMVDIVHEASARVLMRQWNVSLFKEIVILQVEACYIKCQCYVEQVAHASPDLYVGTAGVDGLKPQALGLMSGNEVPLQPRFRRMKEKIVELVVQGMNLAKTLDDTALVENGAIYLWNYHHHLFRTSNSNDHIGNVRLEKTIPAVKDAFENALATLQEVGSSDFHLVCRICEGLARIFEFEKNGARVEEVCKVGIDMGKNRPSVIKPLVACVARVQKLVGGVKGPIGGGSAVLETIGGVEVLGLSEVADAEKLGMLTKIMDSLLNCRELLLFREGRGEEDAQESKQTVFTPGAVIEKTLEDVEEGHSLWVEMWFKIAQNAVDIGSFREAQVAANQAASAVPDSSKDRASIPRETWRWHALAEAAWATAIVKLIDSERQERTLQEELRANALSHFCLACRWGTQSGNSGVVLSVARQMWNASVPFISSPLTRRLVMQPIQIVVSKLAEVGEQSDLSLRLKFYLVLLDCYRDGEDWKNGLDAVDEAFQYIPSSLQKPLWSMRVVFLSKLGGNVAEGLSKMKQSDASMQAKAWLTLAELSSDEKASMCAYLSAIDCVEGTMDCIECYLQFSQWLYCHRFPRGDIIGYAFASLDLLLDVEGDLGEEEEEDEADDGGSRAPTQLTGRSKARESTRGISRSKSRSSVGSKGRGSKSSRAPSTSAMSSTVITTEDDGTPSRLDVVHLEQIIRSFVILAQISCRADERRQFFNLAHGYAVKMLKTILETANDRSAADVYASLSQEEQEELTFEAFKERHGNASVLPSSDVEWCGFAVTEELLTKISLPVNEAVAGLLGFSSSNRATLSSESIPNVIRTLSVLDNLADGLIQFGDNVLACAVFHLNRIVSANLGGNCVEPLTRLVFLKMFINYDSLNLETMAKDCAAKCKPLVPGYEELKLFEEDISQREQAILEENDSENISFDTVRRDKIAMHRNKIGCVEVRYVWIDLAKWGCRIGDFHGAKELLVNAVRHARAYKDDRAISLIDQVQSSIAESEGFLDESINMAERSIFKSVTTVNVYHALGSILRRCSVYERSRRAVMARELLTDAILTFQQLGKVGRSGADVGVGILKKRFLGSSSPSPPRVKGNETEGTAGDLDANYAKLVCSAELARLEAAAGAALKDSGSPWANEWKKCSSRFLETINGLEKLGFSMVLPRVLNAYADACLTFGKEGAIALGANADATTEDHAYATAVKFLERGQAHALNAFNSCVPSDVTSPLSQEISLPASRTLVQLKVRLSRMYIHMSRQAYENEGIKEQTRRMNLRRMNAARGSGSGGETIIDKWLDATAPKPPMSEEEKQVLPHGMAVILASSAHAVGARVPKIKAETLACLGNAIVHSAQKGKELMGGWLPSGASDPDDQEDYDEEDSYCREQRGANGDTLRKQGERLLKRAISEGIKEERWDIVGSAADGLVECYAAIEPTESAKMMMLRQSCRVSSKFYDLFKTACGQKNRELLFLQQQERLKEEFLHPSVSSSYVQNHAYLSATSQVWKKLDCSASVESILENFPPSTCCLLIDADENLKKLYAGILRRVPEKGLVGEAAMHILDDTERGDLKNLLIGFEGWVKRNTKFLLRYGPTCGPSGDRDLIGERTAETNDTYEQEFQTWVQQMEDLLSLVLKKPTIKNAIEAMDVENIVLFPDFRFAGLPLEAMKLFRRDSSDRTGVAPVLTRDFSIHLLSHRLKVEDSSNAGAFANTSFIVDPQFEDKKSQEESLNEDSSSSEPDDPESPLQSIATFEVHSHPSWNGVKGSEHIPSATEWQQVLMKSNEGAMFVYYGFSNMLSYFDPSQLVGMRLGGCRLALLLSGTATDGTYRRQGKLDNQKLPELIGLEKPVESAALLSLCGVRSIAINSWGTSLHANRRLYLKLMPLLKQGKPIADCVHEISRAYNSERSESDLPDLKERVRYSMVIYGMNSFFK